MTKIRLLAIHLTIAALCLACSSSEDDASGKDAGAPVEAGTDAVADATGDATEASVDAPPEASPEAAAEASTEASTEAAPEASGPRLLATIDTTMGTIVVQLYPDATPVTVENFQKYADAQFYDGLLFHRVIPDFMIQGGGYEPGMVSRDALFPPIVNEAPSSGLSNVRGTIAMARTSDPNSATSEFFINTADNPHLNTGYGDAGYAVFGAVVEGMDVVDAIEAVETTSVSGHDDVPVEDVVIESISVALEP